MFVAEMAKKRYHHDYTDGELVRDTQYQETFVFSDSCDGFRAQYHGQHLRRATDAERDEFRELEKQMAAGSTVNKAP